MHRARIRAAVAVLSVVLLAAGLWGMYRWRQTSGWLATKGVVIGSRAQPPEVRYTYAVGGRAHVNNRMSYLPLLSQGPARRLASEARPGTQVRVFYERLNPANAVLVKTGLRAPAVFLALGLLGLAVAWWVGKSRAPSRADVL